ncbi:MAG TPA: DUF2127 domain-containing protein [Kofleriaceae bacterium]
MTREGRSDTVILLIGIFKLVKCAGLIAIGFGALTLLHGDAREHATHWARALHMDPESHFLKPILETVGTISVGQMRTVGILMFAYAGLFLTEGLGLLLHKVWAEYMTTILTVSFIPLEVYELVHRASVAKALVLLVNVAIVLYLVLRLRSKHHWPFRQTA